MRIPQKPSRPVVRFAFVAAATVALALIPPAALAHRINLSGVAQALSRSAWHLEDDDLVADVVLSRFDAVNLVRAVDEQNRSILGDQAIETVVTSRIDVSRQDRPCTGAVEPPTTLDREAFRARIRYRCPADEGPYRVRMGLLTLMGSSHKHLASVDSGRGARTDVLGAGSASFEVEPGAARPLPWGFLPLGIHHILGGWDHLVFLFGLILLGGRFRTLLGTITAFTVAHSITLALAALEVWNPGSRFIEPAIGLTIAYVGVENLFLKEPRGRWRITFFLGLVHGFAFASALAEAGLGRQQIVPALLLFNVGVEAGQLAVLAGILPLVLWARRVPWVTARAVPATSIAIAATGLALFVLRLG